MHIFPYDIIYSKVKPILFTLDFLISIFTLKIFAAYLDKTM